MPILCSLIIVAVAVLLAGHVLITGTPGEASGPSPGPAASGPWGIWQGAWSDGKGGTLRLASNALAESINGRIQTIKRMACGFRNTERFQRSIYFHLGDLDLHPESVTHTKA